MPCEAVFFFYKKLFFCLNISGFKCVLFFVVPENQCAVSDKHLILVVSDSYILTTLKLCMHC